MRSLSLGPFSLKSFSSTSYTSADERLTVGPVEKLLKYKKVPFKGIITLLLLIFIFVQTILFTQKRQRSLINMQTAMAKAFMPKDYMTNKFSVTDEGVPTFYFTDMQAVLDDVKKTVTDYYGIARQHVGTFVYRGVTNTTSNGTMIYPPIFTAWLYQISRRDLLTSNTTIKWNARKPQEFTTPLSEDNPHGDIIGAFVAENKTRLFFDRLQKFQIQFGLVKLDFSDIAPKDTAQCIHWDFKKVYTYLPRGGHLDAVFYIDYEHCATDNRNVSARMYLPVVWMAMVIMILAILSLILSLKSAIHRLNILRKDKDSWKKMKEGTYWERGTFFLLRVNTAVSLWTITGILSDILLIINFPFIILYQSDPNRTNFIMGFGAITQYLSVMRYFQYTPKFYMLVSTLSRAFPNLIRFLISAIPLFLGFALCGSLLFGHYATYFDEVIDSITTLFSVMNGDQVRVVFNMLFGYNMLLSVVSRLYIYIFSIIFTMMVLNFFVGIVGDAFDTSKIRMEEKIQIAKANKIDPEIQVSSTYEECLQIIAKQDGKESTMEDVLSEHSLELMDRIRRTCMDPVNALYTLEDTVEMRTEAFNARFDELYNALTNQ